MCFTTKRFKHKTKGKGLSLTAAEAGGCSSGLMPEEKKDGQRTASNMLPRRCPLKQPGLSCPSTASMSPRYLLSPTPHFSHHATRLMFHHFDPVWDPYFRRLQGTYPFFAGTFGVDGCMYFLSFLGHETLGEPGSLVLLYQSATLHWALSWLHSSTEDISSEPRSGFCQTTAHGLPNFL